MGAPEEYDWGLHSEQIENLRAEMVVSVAIELDASPPPLLGRRAKEREVAG